MDVIYLCIKQKSFDVPLDFTIFSPPFQSGFISPSLRHVPVLV